MEFTLKFSFLHISDIHLGRTFSDLSKYAYNNLYTDLYRNSIENSLNKIYEIATEKNVDFILIAGDTFDSKEQDFYSKIILKNFFKKLDFMGIKVFLVCGNHDPLSSYNKNTFDYDKNSNIKIIGLNTKIYGSFPIYNKNNEKICILHAISFNNEIFNDNPLKYLDNATENEFNICLMHCDLNGDKSSTYAPCNISELESKKYDYCALGHIHIPSLFRNNIIYSGTIQSRSPKELGSHGIRLIEVQDNNIINNEFISTDNIRFEELNINISDATDITSALDIILEQLNIFIADPNNNCELFLINLNLIGYISFYSLINNEFFDVISNKIESEFSGKIYIARFSNLLSPIINTDILNNNDGIIGELFQLSQDNNMSDEIFNELCIELKPLLNNCNLTENEFKEYKNKILNDYKKECLNICGKLYSDIEAINE